MSARDASLDDFAHAEPATTSTTRRRSSARRPDPATPPTSPPVTAPPAREPAPNPPAMLPPGVFDLRELKAEARRLLAPGHPVRLVVEAEPDYLHGPDSIGRMTVILRLILAHRRQPA